MRVQRIVAEAAQTDWLLCFFNFAKDFGQLVPEVLPCLIGFGEYVPADLQAVECNPSFIGLGTLTVLNLSVYFIADAL